MLHARKDYNKRIQDTEGIIGKKEPVFLLRAQDEFMYSMLNHYLSLVQDEYGEDPGNAPLEVAILKHMVRVIKWQADNNTKAPDIPVKEIL